VVPLAAGLAAILAGCLVVAPRRPGRPRALALAVAAGVLYGVTAGLIKAALQTLHYGVAATSTSWTIYGVVVCGLLGFLLSQNAFQSKVALAPALSLIIVLDPLVGIGIGVLWLGESVRSGAPAILGELAALVALVAGVAVLSRRAPQVATQSATGNGRARTAGPKRAVDIYRRNANSRTTEQAQ